MTMEKHILLSGMIFMLLTGCNVTPAVTIAPRESPTLAPQARPAAQTTSPTSTPESKALPTINPTSPADSFAFEQNRRLGRGVNLGNALEAPVEGEWGMILEEGFFDLISEAGFNTVRVPIRWSAHAEEKAPYTIEAAFFERIDWVVEQALARELNVILDMHHYEEIMESPLGHKARFLAIWEQIAKRYQGQPEAVYFELLNEPTGTLGATSWSKFAAEAITIIRKTNPRRTIILGPGNWNDLYALYGLQLPEEERNLIVTIHYYQPFQFTHQGAEWVGGSELWMGTTWEGNDYQKDPIIQDFDFAVKWANQNRRPIFLGEFGAYSKADLESRVRWTAFVARQAEAHGFSWAYWEFGAGFGVYDRERQAWNEPILRALIPGN